MRKTYLLIVSMILISIILVGCQSNDKVEGSNADIEGQNADVVSNADVDVSNMLLSKINISNSKGFATVNTDFFAVYEDEETLETLQNAFTNAVMVAGMVDMMEPEYDLEFIYKDGTKEAYHLWIGERKRDTKSTIMKVEDTHFIYTISEEATNLLLDMVK